MTQPDLPETIVLADTATKLGPHAAGAVIVTGSHGGRYAAYLTLKAHPRAVIHNDAGVGKDEAGIAVIAMAEALGVAAATASHTSCRIGDTADMMARGRISHANAPARALGVAPGMTCRDAALRLVEARTTGRDPEPCAETRRILQQPGWRRRIVLMDSASLVAPEDAGQIIVTGSHGALVGGSAQMALRVDAFAAVFSDAGVGARRCRHHPPSRPRRPRHRRCDGVGRFGPHRRCRLDSCGRHHLARQRDGAAAWAPRSASRSKRRLAAWAELA